MTGFVSLEGADPGYPELLILKAMNNLGRADAVLIDDLSAGPILSSFKPIADLLGVDERAGRATPKQNLISRKLVDHAKTDQRVVRPIYGGSRLFARWEEELVALREEGTTYEITQDVHSAFADACGNSLTWRLTARRVRLVVGYESIEALLPQDIGLCALADHSIWTVVFMGKCTFPQLLDALLARGLANDRLAILSDGVSKSDQDVLCTTVSTLAKKLTNEIGNKPGLILYEPLADLEEVID